MLHRNLYGVPRVARAALRAAPDSWAKWLAFCDASSADDFEMTCEEAAAACSLVSTLVRLGVPFDRSFLDHVDALRAELDRHDVELEPSVDDGDEDADPDFDLSGDRAEFGMEAI